MKLRSLNQDALERYFGQIRQTCGSKTDPTLSQFVGGMKTLLVQTVTAPTRGSNCEANDDDDDDDSFLKDVEDFLKESRTLD